MTLLNNLFTILPLFCEILFAPGICKSAFRHKRTSEMSSLEIFRLFQFAPSSHNHNISDLVIKRRSKRVPLESDDEDLIYSGLSELGSGVPYETTTTLDSRSLSSFEIQYYRISLTIGKSWSPALESKKSSAFRMYEEELKREIQAGMGPDVKVIQVLQFINIQDSAFIRCIFDLRFIGGTKEKLEENFETLLDFGAIGKITVRFDGFYVKNIGAPPEKCKDSELQCKNDNCVDISKRCDSINDCEDNTDEQGCETVFCGDGEFSCANRTCIPLYFKCDGRTDCSLGEDELNCTETCKQIACGDGSCIPTSYQCDQYSDCFDDSDEMNCTTKNDPVTSGTSLNLEEDVGQPITLICPGNNSEGVFWKKGLKLLAIGSEIVAFDDTNYLISNNGTKLTIKNTTIEDSGNYTCRVAGGMDITFSILVQEIIRIVRKPMDLEVVTGKRATFHCNAIVTSKSTVQIEWQMNSKMIDFRNVKRLQKFQDNSLVIGKTKRQDAGIYTCVAHTASFVNATASAKLTILDDDTFTCQVVGRVKPLSRWMRNEEEKSGVKYRIVQSEHFQSLKTDNLL